MTALLNGKIAIVIGAGGGICGAIARAFADNGAIVIVADLDGQDAMATQIGDAAGPVPGLARERPCDRPDNQRR